MESAYKSMTPNLLNAGNSKGRVRYSSICERLSTINADYFEKLHQQVLMFMGKVWENLLQMLLGLIPL